VGRADSRLLRREKNAYLDASVARAIAEKFAAKGTNLWYDATPAQLLEGVTLPAGWPAPAALTCGRDTLDVWIDSGSSHAASLRRGQGGTEWPADLYLEGSDQHRGWFQSSLWTSVIAFDAAPYKAVLTHGFIVDARAQQDFQEQHLRKAADQRRLRGRVRCRRHPPLDLVAGFPRRHPDFKGNPLPRRRDATGLIRNACWFQLSNCSTSKRRAMRSGGEASPCSTRWALHQAAALINDCTRAYEAYEFHRVYQLCNQFCSVTLSATYHDILKDRLAPRHALAAAPLLADRDPPHLQRPRPDPGPNHDPFATDEAWAYATAKSEYSADSIHLQDRPAAPAEWTNPDIAGVMAARLQDRAKVNEAIEPLRAAGKIGKSLDVAATLPRASGAAASVPAESLAELFIVSHVEVAAAEDAAIGVRPCAELGFAPLPALLALGSRASRPPRSARSARVALRPSRASLYPNQTPHG
jgi:isoleucyl-tRNA synthetase